MKRIIPFLLLTAFCCINTVTYAQTDSGYIDLGRIKMKSNLTQSITIKGEDLEKMPFSSLHEAINVYLYGTNSNEASLVYVIDGMLLNDVNAYSVYDIESVTLVQNALAHVSGASIRSQLVLVTTRTGSSRKDGITAAASGFAVNKRRTGSNKNIDAVSSPDFFQQYYISINKHHGKMSFGASANLLREVVPTDSQLIAPSTPYHFNRFRLNAWFNTKLGKSTDLTLRMNAVPQQRGSDHTIENSMIKSDGSLSGKELYLVPSVNLFTRFLRYFTNELNGSYLYATHKDDQHTNGITQGIQQFIRDEHYDSKERILRIKDDITYRLKAGHWSVEPSLNMMFTSTSITNANSARESQSALPGNFPSLSGSQSISEGKGETLLLTPNVGFYFRNSIAVQGGVQFNTNPFSMLSDQDGHVSPFVTASLDVIKMVKPESSNSLALFGSYAKRAEWGEYVHGLSGVNSGFNSVSFGFDFTGSIPGVLANPDLSDQDGHVWKGGLNLALLNDRLKIGYNYQDSHSSEFVAFLMAGTINYFYNLESVRLNSNIHRISIGGELIRESRASWRTGINVSGTLMELKDRTSGLMLSGDVKDREWRGGWFNHFRYGDFIAGLNVLYNFKQPTSVRNSTTIPVFPIEIYDDANVFLLQNIYFGYHLTAKRYGAWEIYASGRNLLQSKKFEQPTGSLKYYGLGVKVGL